MLTLLYGNESDIISMIFAWTFTTKMQEVLLLRKGEVLSTLGDY